MVSCDGMKVQRPDELYLRPWYPHTTLSPSSRPFESGTRRCQQASSSAVTCPSACRYMTTCLPQIVRGNSACLISASHATAYHAFIGKFCAIIMLLVENFASILHTFMIEYA